MTSIDIPFAELPQRDEFIGKPILEDGVEVQKPLSRFDYTDGLLTIYVTDKGNETCMGCVRGSSAELSPDGVLYISGMLAPAFLLFTDEAGSDL